MTQPAKKDLFIVTGEFTFQGRTYLPGDGFTPPAGYVLIPHSAARPENDWAGQKFHIEASKDGGIVQDDYVIGGQSETAPSRPAHDEIMPLRPNLEGAIS